MGTLEMKNRSEHEKLIYGLVEDIREQVQKYGFASGFGMNELWKVYKANNGILDFNHFEKMMQQVWKEKARKWNKNYEFREYR